MEENEDEERMKDKKGNKEEIGEGNLKEKKLKK
jgi:hypothetical protein